MKSVITPYIVEIGYRRFVFDDLEEACAFAEIAVRASVDEDEATVRVTAKWQADTAEEPDEESEAPNVDVP